MYDHELFSIAALQLCRDTDLDETSEHGFLGPSRRRLARCFLTQFREKWEPGRNLWGSSDHRWTGSTWFNKPRWEDLVFQYHMRVFTTAPWVRPSGRGLERVSGKLKGHKNDLAIFEMRYSVGLKTTWALELPVFSLVTMADSITADSLKVLAQLPDTSSWTAAGIRPSIHATGMAAFAFRIDSLLPEWGARWTNLLDEIDSFNVLSADVSKTLLFLISTNSKTPS